MIVLAYNDVPKSVRDFLLYMDVVKGRSKKTVYEYYLDLRSYFKYLYSLRASSDGDIEELDVSGLGIDFIKEVTLEDTYAFLFYLKENRNCNNSTVNRKCCSIRMYFKYMCNKTGALTVNPVENLESSALPRTLPKFLSLEECQLLLNSTRDGDNKKRDYAILVLFLNCGMRLSELVGINLSDLGGEYLTITGKGNKQRNIYLNPTCVSAVRDYIEHERKVDGLKEDARNALFISRQGNRMSRRMVQYVVENHLKKSGLGNKRYSTHKLRHTAATMMHRYGGADVRVLQEVLGHENLSTTQIYTHIGDGEVKAAMAANPIADIKVEQEKND